MLTPNQTAVLRHLVRIEPVSHNANDVSRHLDMDVPTAVLCLQELRRLGYVRYGKESMGEGPEVAEHVPTDEGKKYLARNP
jgi:DNA-binding IclR family transcriptional regulator